MAQAHKFAHIWNDESLIRATVESCDTIVGVMRKLGVTVNNGNTSTLKSRCKQYGIELPKHGASIGGLRTSASRRQTPEDVFCVRTSLFGGARLKKYMLAAGFEDKCAVARCGQLPTRFGKPLTLQVDHINGNPYDNTMTNLQILCPNCHTQTATYAGKRRATD